MCFMSNIIGNRVVSLAGDDCTGRRPFTGDDCGDNGVDVNNGINYVIDHDGEAIDVDGRLKL